MNRDDIEYQETIAEAKAGSYKPIRFSRIKYTNNPNTLIDIRVFQRGYDEEGEETFFPTKQGFQFLESEFKKVVNAWTVLPSAYMHKDVMDKSFELLAKGQYESAVIQAFKRIEILIRRKAKLAVDQVGIRMIRKAFDPNSGPLADLALPLAERESLAHYIAGAYGLYKNPCSHRDVKMSFVEAFERIAIASNILKLVESSPANTDSEPHA